MEAKRRDNKNRLLQSGESQRKDGKYMYRYMDTFGERQTVYSWKLVATDTLPSGKKDDTPLRDKTKFNKTWTMLLLPAVVK